MRIKELHEVVAELPFLNAGRGVGNHYEDKLPVQVATVDKLPDGLAAIVVTGDLQGREHYQYQTSASLRLLGEWLPQVLCDDVLPSLGLPAGRIGALLAGDFYTVPNLDKRGGSGDVSEVWNTFGRWFSWVVGVAGNHDTFGREPVVPPRFSPPLYFLDQESKVVDGMLIAGISGIVGSSNKPWRESEEEFEVYIHSLKNRQPDFLLMHDGPDAPELRQRGSSRIREALSGLSRTIVIRGHAHWDIPFVELTDGPQVLNVDARVIILRSV